MRCANLNEEGYISDKMGRKFGMVGDIQRISALPDTVDTGQMSASVIVALFALLSSASTGAHGSLPGMLAMLSAMRCDH